MRVLRRAVAADRRPALLLGQSASSSYKIPAGDVRDLSGCLLIV
jgi:hypothetical protein